MTVPLSRPLIRLAARDYLPRRTLRLRLTLLYGGLFLACGAALLAITYVLVAHATVKPGYARSVARGFAARAPHRHGSFSTTPRSTVGQAVVSSVLRGQRILDLHQLVIWSAIALAGMAVASILLGWIVAGRALRPLRTITQTTREISATNLHQRLGLHGPDDELKDLGDTIDALLARLEDSFRAQRAFVANASHELRTPLALTRAMLQFALADPKLTFDELKTTCAEVLDAGAEHEQLIEALLMLARSQQGIEHREPFDLAPIVEEAIDPQRSQAAELAVTIHATLRPTPTSGNPRLVRRLVSNLLENALRYNVAHGHVRVLLEPSPRHATLTVANTGPHVPAGEIERLTQPFKRLTPDRTADAHGHGLGLSIVAAITAAHDASLDIQPNSDGGLLVVVTFPTPAPSKQARPPSFTPEALAAPGSRP